MRTPQLELAFKRFTQVREYLQKGLTLNLQTLQSQFDLAMDTFAEGLDEPEPQAPAREVIQIEATEYNLYALCSDGTMWIHKEQWELVTPIPPKEN